MNSEFVNAFAACQALHNTEKMSEPSFASTLELNIVTLGTQAQ